MTIRVAPDESRDVHLHLRTPSGDAVDLRLPVGLARALGHGLKFAGQVAEWERDRERERERVREWDDAP